MGGGVKSPPFNFVAYHAYSIRILVECKWLKVSILISTVNEWHKQNFRLNSVVCLCYLQHEVVLRRSGHLAQCLEDSRAEIVVLLD